MIMKLPMLTVFLGSALVDRDEYLAAWERTVSSMLKNDAAAAQAINLARGQLRLIESWFEDEMMRNESQIVVSLSVLTYEFDVCVQRIPRSFV
jgi:hypothetical protein